jgi:hypothetical protein
MRAYEHLLANNGCKQLLLSRAEPMNDTQRRALIERYTLGFEAVREALSGMTAAQPIAR